MTTLTEPSTSRLSTNYQRLNQENVKDIEKCGWISLKLNNLKTNIKNYSKYNACYQKYWAMFYVINENHPYLELFSEEQPINVTSSKSINKFSLKNCSHVSVPILFNEQENDHEFVITLDEMSIQVYVENKELLKEWVNCLKTKLSALNVILPKDNIYSKEPISIIKKINRPLPPIPTENNQTSTSSMDQIIERLTGINRQPNATNHRSNQSLILERSNFNQNIQNYNRSSSINNQNFSQNNISLISNDISIMMREENNLENNSSSNNQVLSLRESQIRNLNREINNRGGVKLRIRKVDCVNSLAFVEWLGHIWVAGWKQKFYPQLHNIFHIGDEIISVNDVKTYSVKDVNRLINLSNEVVEIIIKRTPFGKPYLIKKDLNGQEIGIVLENKTAEISYIEFNSLAEKFGIKNKTKCVDPLKNIDVNWVITEINHRPLNLFFKNDETKKRLNAVGCEISLLLQPADLIKNFKKQLKLIKNYKDYLVQ